MLDAQPIPCPESIWQWELAHGIFRTEHPTAGLIVHCPNFAATSAQMDKEKATRENDYRLWLFSKTPQGFTEWLREREAAKK
jgi:polyferredoxin